MKKALQLKTNLDWRYTYPIMKDIKKFAIYNILLAIYIDFNNNKIDRSFEFYHEYRLWNKSYLTSSKLLTKVKIIIYINF